MQILKQGDPRWGNKKIGATNLIVRNYGCCISSVSMSSDYFKYFKDPGFLAKYLYFTSQGLLIWSSIANILNCKFLWRGYTHNFKQSEVDEAIKNPTKTCLGNVQGGKHWVLLIYRVPFTTKYWVADPFTGTRKFYSGVVGYSILQKK